MNSIVSAVLIARKSLLILERTQNEIASSEKSIMTVHAILAKPTIPGTTLFDGEQARRGYALNRMCFSFNDAGNRQAFLADEDAYCDRYGLTPEQRAAVKAKNVLQLIAAGGNVYYLAKFAGIFGLDVQDIGAQQTGLTKEQFKQKLIDAGR